MLHEILSPLLLSLLTLAQIPRSHLLKLNKSFEPQIEALGLVSLLE